MPQDQETAAKSEWEARGGREVRRREGEAGEGARVCGEFRRSRAASRGSEGGGRRESARRSAGWMKVVREKRASVSPNWRSGGKGKPPPWLCSSSLLYTHSLITTSSRNSLYYFYMVQIGEKISPQYLSKWLSKFCHLLFRIFAS
jgi:hypothetical protein